jgi:hypothetical protein
MTEDLNNLDNPVQSARMRLLKVGSFFFWLFKYVGFFLLGILVGMGLVLRDPMPNKAQDAKIKELEQQNVELKKQLSKNVDKNLNQKDEIKERNSFVID